MIIKGKIMTVSPTQSGVSQRGNAWRKCDVIIISGTDEKEDRIVATAWGDALDKLSAYPVSEHPVWDIELVFTVRDAYNFTGRKYQDIGLVNLAPIAHEPESNEPF